MPSTQPVENDNISAETIYIPSTEPDVEAGISGSPPAILDNWLQLQRAFTLESVDNGNAPLHVDSCLSVFVDPEKAFV